MTYFRFHLSRSSASSFSPQYLLLLLTSRSSVLLLLPTPFTSVICPSMASWRKQFLLKMRPIQLAFLSRILLKNVLFSPISSRSRQLLVLRMGNYIWRRMSHKLANGMKMRKGIGNTTTLLFSRNGLKDGLRYLIPIMKMGYYYFI